MFLCDTNIISELARSKPNPKVLSWSTGAFDIGISVITVEEIFYGLAWKQNPRIKAWFEAFLGDRCRVFPVTDDISRLAGELRGQFQSQGKTRSQADMIIAATARIHQLTLVTRNIRDFDGCNIKLFNPF